MFEITNMTKPAYLPTRARTPLDFGQMFCAERKAVGMTQLQVAQSVGCRRQTISDLEAGKNIGLLTIFTALSAIGKTIAIQSNHFDLVELNLFLESVAE